ncbi:alpha-L-fucosidase [Aeoliella sp.]|uniref:alpha-L-fucosidase n=1 Tax=Aeoliella sp. TaxID=2795800 RepID=UPI003CCC10BD
MKYLLKTLCLCATVYAGVNAAHAAEEDTTLDETKQLIWKAAHVTPHDRQVAWQELEYAAYAIYGMPTYHGGVEWGTGNEDPRSFNPTEFDARQWMKIYKDAGMKHVIFMVKHCDGFCLWPSKYTDFSVKNSPWKDGKGDIVREVVDACREFDLKIGFYISPLDLHEPTYGTPAYDEFFKNQLQELLTEYGEITEVWLDGFYTGPKEDKHDYDWEGYYRIVRRLQPNAVIAVCGPDVRWVGNESGIGRETEWSVVPASIADQEEVSKDFFELFAIVPEGRSLDLGSRPKLSDASRLIWYPAETNVSIRPNWFHRPSQDNQIKSVQQLLDLYYQSAGRNGLFLLGVPPAVNGLIHENDAKRLMEFRRVLDAIFNDNLALDATATASEVRGDNPAHGADRAVDDDKDTYWTTEDWTEEAELELDLGEEKTFNVVLLQEQIRVGQRVEVFALEAWDGQKWNEFARATTIGYKRLLRCNDVTTRKVRLKITGSRVCPTISNFGLYYEPPLEEILGE